MFIHDAILESITCGNTQVSAADLQRAVTKLKQRDPHTKLTGYEQQYKVLCDITYCWVRIIKVPKLIHQVTVVLY